MDTTTPNAVQVDRRAFLAALARLHGVTGKNQFGKPILRNIRALVAGGNMNLLASDFETTAEINLPTDGPYSGAFLLPCKETEKALRRWSGDRLTLTIGPERIHLQEPGAQLSFPAGDVSLFPSRDDEVYRPRFSIEAAHLARTLECTVPFTDRRTWTSQGILNGIHIAMQKEDVRFEGMDGRTCAQRHVAAKRADRKASGSCTIPAPAFALWMKATRGESGAVAVAWGEKKARLSLGAFTLTAKLLEGTYPTIWQHFPKEEECSTWARVDASVLAGALQGVSVLERYNGKPVACRYTEGRIIIACAPHQHGQAVKAIPAQHAGETVQVGYDADRLLDLLPVAKGGIIEIGISPKRQGTLFRVPGDHTFRALLMPWKVDFEAPDVALPEPEPKPQAEPAPVPAVQTKAGRIAAHIRAMWLRLSAFASRYFSGPSEPATERAKRPSKARANGGAPKSPLTPEQRSAIARKAVETRRQRLAAG